ncbi:MAG: WcbI family polysaccharide biosynthesis putative acetyltransferase [Desulfobulbaceae bacterium]|nr:WcbI family polysaccharide biosynthesis putative acetyltransferase [Desulfobulbaceae bacterium]
MIFANCQSGALGQILMEHKGFSSVYEWEFLPAVQDIKEQDIPDVITKVKNADLFLYQPVSVDPIRPIELSSDYLVKQVKPSAKVISFPSIYFDGYFPHLQTFKGYVSALNLVHDYFIAYACSIGLSVEQTIQLIQNDNLYPKEVSIRLAGESLKNLSDRESEFDLDIKISDFIRGNYKKVKLFNQFNHPKRVVFKYISEQILEKIGFENPCIDEAGDSHLDGIMTPIYRSTYKNLQCKFNEEYSIYSGLNNPRLTQLEVVKSFFAFYQKQNLEEIKMHVLQTKPFVSEIVDKKVNGLVARLTRTVTRYVTLLRGIYAAD